MINPETMKSPYRSLLLPLLFLLLLPVSWNEAAAQNTYRLSKAPFYRTFDKKQEVRPRQKLVYLPAAIDAMTREEFFYEGREQALQPLIEAINGYLDSLSLVSALPPATLPETGAPYLFVGSSESVIAPPSSEMLREPHDKYPPMVMHLGKPGKSWKAALEQTLGEAGADYTLVFRIGFNEYPKADKGLFKKKVVLGTGYEPEIRFLSGEPEPVEVLQVTGLLLDRKGNVVRAGAEAFLYEDSPFWVQVLGARTSIDDRTLSRSVTGIRRDDLPGRPPAWKVAMYHLIRQLTRLPQDYTAFN